MDVDTETANKILQACSIVDVDDRAHVYEHSIDIRDWQMAGTLSAVQQQADATPLPETYSDLPGDGE